MIHRADNGWAGSTINGYVKTGDDKTYLRNFRCSRETFGFIVAHLQSSRHVTANGCRNPLYCMTAEFKVAVCMYFLAQDTGLKAAADAASLGESTVRKYLVQFQCGVLAVLRPIYMPGTPPTPDFVDTIREEFASRRGVPNVAMAVDGTHVPFHPEPGKWHSLQSPVTSLRFCPPETLPEASGEVCSRCCVSPLALGADVACANAYHKRRHLKDHCRLPPWWGQDIIEPISSRASRAA